MKHLLILAGVGCSAQVLHAQEKLNPSHLDKPCKFTLGVFTGVAIGATDATRNRPGLAFGLATERRFASGLLVFAKLNSSSFNGSTPEIYYPEDNTGTMYYPAWSKKDFSYKSNVTDMSLNVGFNLSRFYTWRPKLSVVLSAGIGLMTVHSSAEYFSTRDERQITETYDGRHMVLPIGLDVHYRITKRLKLGVAASYNYFQNDNLDLINPPTLMNTSWDRFGTVGLVLKYKVL